MKEVETVVEGVKDWVCAIEWLGEEEEVEEESQMSLSEWECVCVNGCVVVKK